MTEQAVSPLRRRMIEDMTIRKFAQWQGVECPDPPAGNGSGLP